MASATSMPVNLAQSPNPSCIILRRSTRYPSRVRASKGFGSRYRCSILLPAFAGAKSGLMSSSRAIRLVIGLKEVFGNTSDPGHFLEFQTRARTLQLLSAPVEHDLNIRLLVGEAGVGKTALLLRLMQQLQSTVLTTRLFWTQLRRSEFLHYFLHKLGIPQPSPNLAEAQKQLSSVLEQNFSSGRKVMVVIDEAHELKISTLAALAELLDCPLGRSEHLRIILAGLPALKTRTASSRFRAQGRRLLDLPALGVGTSSNNWNRGTAHNLFCIRPQSAVVRATPCQLALATGLGMSAWRGPGLPGSLQVPCSNPKLS